MKNYLLNILKLIVLASIFSGCAPTLTMALYDGSPGDIKTDFYDEKIDHFAMTKDQKNIIFVGQKYNYVFENSTELSYLLKQQNNNNFIVDLEQEHHYESSNFIVEDDAVSIKFQVYILDNNLTHPFSKINMENQTGIDDATQNYTKVYLFFKGKRYLSDPSTYSFNQSLSKSVEIRIEEKTTINEVGDIINRTVLTPFTLAADATVLLPFNILFYQIMKSMR